MMRNAKTNPGRCVETAMVRRGAHSLQEVEIESIREKLARMADAEHSN